MHDPSGLPAIPIRTGKSLSLPANPFLNHISGFTCVTFQKKLIPSTGSQVQNKSVRKTFVHRRHRYRNPEVLMKTASLYFLLFLLTFPVLVAGQQTDSITVIRLTASVYDKETGRPLPTLMIVNKRTMLGFFSSNETFEVKLFDTDTLLIGSPGYQTLSLCLRDSVRQDAVSIRLFLSILSYQAKEVEVFGARDLDKIQSDIEKLGYSKKDYMLSDLDALNSPITFLYQQFSRKERAKRDLAELKNNDRRRALLKELFSRYVAADLMDLDTREFDDFIDFCNVSDEFMKSSSQYEFILYIRKKFEVYRMIRKSDPPGQK